MKEINDQGSAILIVLLMLVSITIIGISSLNITSIESKITGNYRSHETTFNVTDGTIFTVAKIIGETVDKKRLSPTLISNGIVASDQETIDQYKDMISGYEGDFSSNTLLFKYGTTPDSNVNTDIAVDVDVTIERLTTIAPEGGAGAEFAIGGFLGGEGDYYTGVFRIRANGTGMHGSRSDIEAIYYKHIELKTGL